MGRSEGAETRQAVNKRLSAIGRYGKEKLRRLNNRFSLEILTENSLFAMMGQFLTKMPNVSIMAPL